MWESINSFYTNPKKLRPILLVENIPTPEAICRYNILVFLVQHNKYRDKIIKSKEKNQNNVVKVSIILYKDKKIYLCKIFF